jgi:hypothetical protein
MVKLLKEDYEEPYYSWTISEEDRIADAEFNFRKILDHYYTHIEENEKSSVLHDIISDYIRTSSPTINRTIEQERTEADKELLDAIKKQEWQKIIALIERLTLQIENNRMSNLIYELIIAIVSSEDLIKDDVFVRDVLEPLHIYLKDVKIYYDIGRKQDALIRLGRCKEILELASVITQIAKDEGLKPLRSSQLVKVDEFGGRPVYKVT